MSVQGDVGATDCWKISQEFLEMFSIGSMQIFVYLFIEFLQECFEAFKERFVVLCL